MSSSRVPVAASPAAPTPAAIPARIAGWVAALDTAGDLTLAEHIEVYQRLHTQLLAALAEIDGP